MMEHMTIDQLPYRIIVLHWLKERYGDALAETIWKQTKKYYAAYLEDLPDYGGKKNGHAKAIYGGLLVFALYPALPDVLPSAPTRSLRKSMVCCMYCRFSATAISSASPRSMGH